MNSTVLDSWEALQHIRRFYFYVEIALALVGLPFVPLCTYLVLTQTPREMRVLKFMLLHTIVANTQISYGVAALQPMRLPRFFGGFLNGPISYVTPVAFPLSLWFTTSVMALNVFLLGLLLYYQIDRLQVERSRFFQFLEVGWNQHYFFVALILSVHVLTAMVIYCLPLENAPNSFNDYTLERLKATEPTFIMISLSDAPVVVFTYLSLVCITLAVGLNGFLALKASKCIRKNAAHVTTKTMEMQQHVYKFLMVKMFDEWIFCYIPMFFLLIGPVFPTYTYTLSTSAFIALTAHSTLYCIKMLWYVRFYRTWILARLCGNQQTPVKENYIHRKSAF